MCIDQAPKVVRMVTSPAYRAPERYGHEFESIEHLNGRFRLQGHPCRFQVVYLDETTTSRREHDGPVVAGEYAFIFPISTMISDSPIEQPPLIAVDNGDLISICGRTFRIQDDRYNNDPRLVRVRD